MSLLHLAMAGLRSLLLSNAALRTTSSAGGFIVYDLVGIWTRADAEEPTFSGDEVGTWKEGVIDSLMAVGLVRRIANARYVRCDACAVLLPEMIAGRFG